MFRITRTRWVAGTLILGVVSQCSGYDFGWGDSAAFTISSPSGIAWSDSAVFVIGVDCNHNTLADECDLYCGSTGGPCDVDACGQSDDCQANSIPDECDIAGGAADGNGNGIPDECEALPPVLPGDLEHQASKNRYISIDPTTSGTSEVALQVELVSMRRCNGDLRRTCIVDGDCPSVCDLNHDLQCTSDGVCGADGPCVPTAPCVQHSSVGTAKWLDEPFTNTCLPLYDCTGQWFSNLTNAAVYRVWTEETLHITACGIVPVASYEVRSTADGVTFSDPLMVGTISKPQVHYGDVVGPVVAGSFTQPDGFVNVTDVQAYLIANQGGATAPHTTWVDLHGALIGSGCLGGDCIVPQQILNVGDLQTIKFGYLGQTYVETPGHENPGDCP